jgi:dienelactone hydrolase
VKITRRQLAGTALAAHTVLAAQEPAPAYHGALDHFQDQVDPRKLDPVSWSRWRYEQMPRRLRFTATTRAQAEAWQKKLRAKLTELVGGFPSPRVPLNAKILEKRDFPGYTREAILFDSRPGLQAFGYLLLPKEGASPHPIVVCIPGHGRGVDDIVGVDDHGQERTKRVGYEFDFALQVVENGMAALAVEPLAFGCRRDPAAAKRGLSANSCQPSAGAALLFGETMIGWRVFDVMRAIDYAQTRPEVDPKRVGCWGISGGGTITLFSAAFEPRIKAAFVSGYLCTFRDSILSLSHCMDNYVPGILQWAEMSDVAGLVAPRGLFAESGTKDNIFPVEAAKQAFAEVKKIYDTFGAPDRCGHEVFEGVHEIHGTGGLAFLKRQLSAA